MIVVDTGVLSAVADRDTLITPSLSSYQWAVVDLNHRPQAVLVPLVHCHSDDHLVPVDVMLVDPRGLPPGEVALPLLYRKTVCYLEKWEMLMFGSEGIDARERLTHLVSIPGGDMPDGIAPSKNADALLKIARCHARAESEED